MRNLHVSLNCIWRLTILVSWGFAAPREGADMRNVNVGGKQIEGDTLALIIGCYGLWALAGWAWSTPYWLFTLIVLPIAIAFHTSLQHETIHGHPTCWAWLNEALVSLPLVAVFPYRRYRDLRPNRRHPGRRRRGSSPRLHAR